MARTSNKSAEIKEQTAEVETEAKVQAVDTTEPDTVDSTPNTADTTGSDTTCDDIDKDSTGTKVGAETDAEVDNVAHSGSEDKAPEAPEEPVDDTIIIDDGPVIADNEVKIQFAPVNIVYPINAYAGPSESMLVGLVAGWMNVEVDTTSEFVHFEKAQGAGVVSGYIRRSDIR